MLPSASATPPPTTRPRRRHWRPKLRWFAAEILIVVCGVLIALTLNAWWANRQRAADEAALRAELRRDVVATREILAGRLELSRVGAERARDILRVMADGADGPARDSVLAQVGSVFTFGIWTPANDTYEEALGSGRLALLTDAELRLALTRYRARSARVGDSYRLIQTQYYEELEPFMVANLVYSEVALGTWRDSLVQGPFRTDYDALARSPELWNLVTLRLEWDVDLQASLSLLDTLAADVLDRLDS